MEPNVEIRRLLDVIPASARMMVKIVSKPEQIKVIDTSFPLPWNQDRLIYINFDLWHRLTKNQRDLLILRAVSWLTAVKWFEPNVYQGVVLAALLGGFIESSQQDVIGTVIALGLATLALVRIWRNNSSNESEVKADTNSIRLALRRGYSEAEATEYLLSAIEAVAKIEGRSGREFIELIRSQNLQIAIGRILNRQVAKDAKKE